MANLLAVSERLQHHAVTMRQRMQLVLPLLLAITLTGALEAKFIAVDARPLNLTPDDRSLYGGLAEYKPRNAGTGEKAYENGGYAADCRREGLICGRPVETGDRVDFHIVSPAAEATRLPVFAFPAWTAAVNGTPVVMRTDAGTGAVSLLLPKGQDHVSLVWRRLPQEWAGMVLSLLSGLTMIFLASRRGSKLLRF